MILKALGNRLSMSCLNVGSIIHILTFFRHLLGLKSWRESPVEFDSLILALFYVYLPLFLQEGF